jgi:hypothetical protein
MMKLIVAFSMLRTLPKKKQYFVIYTFSVRFYGFRGSYTQASKGPKMIMLYKYFRNFIFLTSETCQFYQVVPLQARCGPECFRRLRLPDFHDIWHTKVVRSSASRTGRLYPRKCSWYSFSLGAEPTPGPWNGRKEI